MTNESSWNVPFTPGATRALETALPSPGGSDGDDISPQAVLLGLLTQSECRAAAILRQVGITVDEVRRRWPRVELREALPLHDSSGSERQSSWSFSPEMRASVALAVDWVAQHLQPPELATEHLLWAVAAGEHEVARWLAERGLTAQAVEHELCRLHQCPPASRGPVPMGEPIDMEEAIASEVTQEPTAPAVASASGVDQSGVLRVIDAAANRAREGLRVVEDYVRFVLDDAHLTQRLKQLRHDLNGAIEPISIQFRLAARETRSDVGTEISTDDEQQRDRPESVLTANFCRLQESLRTLEEFLKLIDPELALRAEQLRYESYTLQRAVEITRAAGARLAEARLCVLLDGRPTLDDFQLLADDLVLAGVDLLQLRDKELDDRALVARGRYLHEITRDGDTLFVMNDRADLALLAGADAVHLGQEDVSVKDARALVGPRMLIGVSVHSIEQARAAVLDGADYLGVGPILPSRTKQFDHYPGPELLRAVATEISLPAFAIGGIDRDSLPLVLATGVKRIAVGSAIVDAQNPASAAAALKSMLHG
jgi:thiamine-phosphate pyrophosphorylase